MDYLTKWSEVFTSHDQKAETIARLLVEQIVVCHGVPEQLLSDRDPNFLSTVVQEVDLCSHRSQEDQHLGYHPQTDGLVECFSLSRNMAKTGTPISLTCCLPIGYLLRSLPGRAPSFCFMGEIPDFQLKLP